MGKSNKLAHCYVVRPDDYRKIVDEAYGADELDHVWMPNPDKELYAVGYTDRFRSKHGVVLKRRWHPATMHESGITLLVELDDGSIVSVYPTDAEKLISATAQEGTK